MRARLFPREYEEITEEDIILALAELAGVKKLYFLHWAAAGCPGGTEPLYRDGTRHGPSRRSLHGPPSCWQGP